MLIGQLVAVSTFDILIFTAMGTMGILGTNFLSTFHTTGFLKSISGLTLGIENNCLKKFNNPKTNEGNY
jgi:hypothetical protein